MILKSIKHRVSILLAPIIFGVCSIASVGFQPTEDQEIAFQYVTSDKVLLKIYEYYDSKGLLEGYTSHVVTPVCEDKLCLEAEVKIYWDLLGNFIKFIPITENPLTKLDHIPFDRMDYQKLHKILSDKSPSFIHLRRNELVNNDMDGIEGVDGISSATVAVVKKDMVEGAIFTCYTLWYIANGGINFKIQEYTRNKINTELIIKMIRSGNTKSHYFLIENIKVTHFELFLNELVSMNLEYDGFFMQRIIKKIPDSLIQSHLVQDFLLSHFDQIEYSSKNELLKKLENIHLQKRQLSFLVKHLGSANTGLNQLIIKILCNNADAENVDVLLELFESLINNKIKISENSYDQLMAIGDQHSKLKRLARKIQNIRK